MRHGRLLARYAVAFGVFHAVWWIAAAYGPLPRMLFPAPPEVYVSVGRLHARGILLPWIGVSLLRVAIGFTIAGAVAVAMGIVLGSDRRLREYAEPIVETLRPIPPIAWIPLTLAWFGPTLASQATIVGVAVFFPTLISAYTGIASADRTPVWVALTMGAGRWRIFRDVVLPGALPAILGGLKIGIGTGLMALVAAEMIGAKSGLGFLIITYYQVANDLPAVMFGMILLGGLGVAAHRAFVRMEGYLLRWMPEVR